jgi:glycosyltransferase involved in cell wall biosynthesis
MSNDKVSVIIPTFNRANLIGQTLDSLIKQSYDNWECIIIDDGSTDETIKILDHYKQIDSRISYYKRPSTLQKGANACRNFGLNLSKGSYIKWFDSDDLLIEDALNIQVSFIKSHKNLDMCIAYASYFKDDTSKLKLVKPNILNSNDVLYDYAKTNLFFSVGGPLWKAKYLNKTQIFFNEKSTKLQDTEFHYNHLKNGLRFKFIDKSLFLYRTQHPDRITSINSNENLLSIYNYWQHVLYTINCRNVKNQRDIHLFLVNNLSVVFYRLIINNSTFMDRLKIIRVYYKTLFKAFKFTGIGIFNYVQVILGFTSTLFFSRGLKFFKIL